MRAIWIVVFIALLGLSGLWMVNKFANDQKRVFLPQKKIVTTSSLAKDNETNLSASKNFQMNYFSKNMPGVRDLEISPKGTLLASLNKEGQIVALPDKDKNGIADEEKILLSGLRKPHGLAFFKDNLFVAEENLINRYIWDEKKMTATFDKKIANLPLGVRHFTRSLAITSEGIIYVSIGSTCDTCFEKHPFIASVIVTDIDGAKPEIFAKGLRNSVFIKVNPVSGELWGTEMGRDFLGDNLPPDEVNIIEKGKDYGWPVCYGERIYDQQFGQKNSQYCENTIPPIFNLPAHVAPLGLTFISSPQFPADWQGDLLVAFHGSWNSSVPVGYKIVRLDIEGSSIVGMEDFITGFIDAGRVIGRPVDVEFGPDGELYISDDKAGAVYRISKLN